MGVKGREWNIQAGEKVHYFADVLQLAKPSLEELPTPVKAHEEQQWRLQVGDRFFKQRIQLGNSPGDFPHDCFPHEEIDFAFTDSGLQHHPNTDQLSTQPS